MATNPTDPAFDQPYQVDLHETAPQTYRLTTRPSPLDVRDYMMALPTKVALPSQYALPACAEPYDQGQEGSCHDDQTEVLTDQGFRLFSQLNGSERLGTVNPESGELTFEVPTRIVRFPYTGPLVCAANQSLNFRVTPDHKMLVRRWDEVKRTLAAHYEFVAAGDLGWYAGLLNRVVWNGEITSDTYTLPGVDHKHLPQRSPRDVPMRAWMRFLGIYLAEGTMLKREQMAGRISYKVQIAASKEREKTFVRETLAAIGIHALELADRFTFHDRQVYEAMESIGLLGVKAGEKRVPAFVFRLGASMIAEFLAGHFAGDGAWTGVTQSHYTSSVQLANDLQTLIFLSGNESRVAVREGRVSMLADGRTIVGSLPEHRVSVCAQKNLSIDRRDNISTEQYDGEVFCAEVPTHHTLVTRREGKVLVSGNCTANGMAGMLVTEYLIAGRPAPDPSRAYLYFKERVIEGDTDQDNGAVPRDGLMVLRNNGVCKDALMPYKAGDFATAPSAEADADAPNLKIRGFYRVPGLLATKAALFNRHAVGLAMLVFQGMETSRNGVVPMPASNGEQPLGGHWLYIRGWQNRLDWPGGGYLILRNSWGSRAGNGQGDFFLPFAYAGNSSLVSEFWFIAIP